MPAYGKGLVAADVRLGEPHGSGREFGRITMPVENRLVAKRREYRLLAVGGENATRFGEILNEIPSAGAAGPLRCNRHDICYQTCHPSSGAGVTSGDRASCDANMLSGMRNVCDAAFPSTCPYSDTALCAAYFIQYATCLEFAGLYWEGLVAQEAFVGAFTERQGQYCKCCP